MKKFTRRNFLQRSFLAAGALGILPARSWSQVKGANGDIRMGVVGLNGRGREHIRAWSGIPGVRVTGLCDVDSAVLDAAMRDTPGATPFADIRKLLEKGEVDAISIATPDHWHALAAIWAIQHQKDVYVETPVAFNVWEGQELSRVASRSNRIVQAGSEARSNPGLQQAVDYVRQGKLGPIKVGRALGYRAQPGIGKSEGPQKPPTSVNYDLWTGPAPLTPPRRTQFHHDWRYFWNYGNGALTDVAAEIDMARWFLGVKKPAFKVIAVGGKFATLDDAETPNTLVSFHDYEHAPMTVEIRSLPLNISSTEMATYKGAQTAAIIECEAGYVVASERTGAKVFDKQDKEIRSFPGAPAHFENFIKAVRSRRTSDLNGGIEEGHQTAVAGQVASISYRTGRYQSPSEIQALLRDETDAAGTINRMVEHLRSSGVDLEKTMPFFGEVIRMNPANEQIVQNKKANLLLRRTPRPGFSIKV